MRWLVGIIDSMDLSLGHDSWGHKESDMTERLI